MSADWKHAYDCVGHETNQEGVPYKEMFSQAEIERLGFEVFRLYTSYENREGDAMPDYTAPPLMQRVIRYQRGFRYVEKVPVVDIPGLELLTEVEVTPPEDDDLPPAA